MDDFAKCCPHLPRTRQVMVEIVAAFDLRISGDFTLVACDEGTDILEQPDHLGMGHGVPYEEIEPGAAAHRPDIDHAVGILAVAGIGRKQMLKRMLGCILEIGAGVWGTHPQIVCNDVPVYAGNVDSFFEFGVVDTETCNFFHDSVLQKV